MSGISGGPGKSQRLSQRRQVQRTSRWSRPETMLFDAAAVLALFVLPCAVGGRHPVGLATLSIAALVACLAWLVRMLQAEEPRWTAGVGEVFLGVGLLIGGIQLVTMPPHLIDSVSPRLHDLLPAFSGGPWSLGTWRTLSLTPGETVTGLTILISQGILALMVYQFARSIDFVERLLVIVVAVAVMLALHGAIQFVGHEGKNFAVSAVSFHEEGGVVKAMFRNRNDFAGFLAVAFGPAIWFACGRCGPVVGGGRSRSTGAWQRQLALPGADENVTRITIGLAILGIVSFAVFASLARGGSIALGAAAITACGLLVRSRHVRPGMGAGMLVVAAVVGIALEIHGMERFTSRMETLFDESVQEKAFGRSDVWNAAWRAIVASPLTGTGIGSHADVSPIMMPPTGATHYVHAESSYLNLAVEAGLPGLAVAVLAMVVALAAAVTVFIKGSTREQAIAAAIAAALVAGAVNGIGHFNWYVPAITTVLIVLGTCVIRMATPYTTWIPDWRISISRSVVGAVVSAAVLLLGLMTSRQITAAFVEPQWAAAVQQSRSLAHEGRSALRAQTETVVEAARATGPGSGPDGIATAGVDAVQERWAVVLAGLEERMALLEAVVAARPDHPRAWAELAVARCEHFGLARRIGGSPITLLDLRLVATSGGFESRAAFDDWLRRVASDDLDDLVRGYEAAKRAVVNAPCSGHAWCVLATLAFLESFDAELPRRCIEQAIMVRPHDGTVLFAAAQQAELDGDGALARARWRECFALSDEHRDLIVALLLPAMSAEQAATMLEPDLAGLRAIDAAWSTRSTPEEMRPVRERLLTAVLAAAEAADAPQCVMARGSLLREAAGLQQRLGNREQAAETLTAAITANPADATARLSRVDAALALDDPDTAAQHLDWLLLRRPDAKAVQARVRQLEQLRIRLASARPTPIIPTAAFPTASGVHP